MSAAIWGEPPTSRGQSEGSYVQDLMRRPDRSEISLRVYSATRDGVIAEEGKTVRHKGEPIMSGDQPLRYPPCKCQGCKGP